MVTKEFVRSIVQDHRAAMQIDCSLRNVFFIVVVLCGGCGSSVSDGAVSGSSPSTVSTGQVEQIGNPTSSTISRVTTPPNRFEKGEGRATTAEQGGDRWLPSEPSIPQSIAKDLSSPDARDRYRALDHWEAKNSKVPLDPVFEAMEDEDPAVRAKATAIVEEYWAVEQEHGKGQNN